jgi:hypothetical protein
MSLFEGSPEVYFDRASTYARADEVAMTIRKENEGKQTTQGALILPRMAEAGGYYFQCCDCALTHRLDFTITAANGLEMRVYAAPKETEDARRERDDFLDEPGQ